MSTYDYQVLVWSTVLVSDLALRNVLHYPVPPYFRTWYVPIIYVEVRGYATLGYVAYSSCANSSLYVRGQWPEMKAHPEVPSR